jgi:hypothetical protein
MTNQLISCKRAFGLAAAAGTTLFVTVATTNAQEIVYNNTTSPLGTLLAQIAAGATTGLEAGDQITLGGAGRTITQFVIKPYNLDVAKTGTARVRFYNYPAVGTDPGSSGPLLWDSGVVNESFPAGQDSLTFTVPNVVVPNEFVWTATFTVTAAMATGTALGLRVYDPPTVGSSANTFFWEDNPAVTPAWGQYAFNGGVANNFGAQATAQNVVVNGACCKPDGTCSDVTNTACNAISGAVFQGTGTACGTTTCPQPGACCLPAAACSFTVQTVCVSGGGVFNGPGSTCAAANCPNLYFYDDGTAEDAVGFGASSGNGLAYANQFVSTTGANTITNIQVAFGVTSILNGLPVTAYIWSDPNQDGSPADAQVLASVAGVISGAVDTLPNNTPTYVNFDIPDTTIPVGQKFFVGFVIQNAPASYPCALDEGQPQHKSWIGYVAPGTFDPNVWTNTTNEDTIAPGNWLIRANATGGGSACYANCDQSTGVPFLNVADFTCFLQKFAQGNAYANCDNSTSNPVLNVGDFTCFLQKFALGCSAP